MEILKQYQLELLKICGIICVILGFFASIVKYQSLRRKRALINIEFSAGILLISELFSYIYDGNMTSFGSCMLRLCNFLVYFLVCFETYSFNAYICSLLMGREKLRKLPKRITAGFVVSSVGMTMVLVSRLAGGLYYTFDSFNCYHRSPLFIISYLFPVAVLLLQISLIIQYRKFLSTGLYLSSLLFAIFPLIGGILQIFNYGFSIISVLIGIAAIVIYASSLVEQNNTLLKSANTEVMTGLPNQYGFIAEVEKVISKHEIKKYNSYYFDIVRMGQYNKKYGSDIGDVIIKKYAEYVAAHIDKDEVLSRLGGNFFIGLIKKEHADDFLEMLQSVPIEFNIGTETEKVSVAAVAGGYEITDSHVIAEHVIGNAAIAINIAKNMLKKPYAYLTKELLDELNESRQLEEKIPSAFKNEEFKVYYQPKVNIQTLELCGAEALVRWKHDDTVIPPFKFVPLMERNENICKLDFYMLEHVCADIVEWLEKGIIPPRISVNFSRKNLGNAILAEEIHNVVKKYNVPENLVQIEITETIDEYPLSYLKKVVEALQNYGMTVAIDDFGTGSSSINLLREISFDVLKIDKQFIECHSEKEVKLLEHIIHIARDIKASVIAEGVEEKDQLEMLKNLGCDEIQGYIFDRPLSKYKFEDRIVFGKYEIK